MDPVERTVVSILLTLILVGLGPYIYSTKTKHFETFSIATIYTILIITVYCSFYVREMVLDVVSGNFDINNVGKLYFYMNITAATVCYMTHTYFVRRHILFLNVAKDTLFDIFLYLDDGQTYRRQIYQVAVKALLFPLLLEITLVVRAVHFEPDRSKLWTLFSLIPYIIRTIPVTSVYGGLLLGTAITKSINARLQLIVDEVNRMHFHKEWLLKTHFHRMQRYCDLSDEVDLINEKYTALLDVITELLDFLSLPWLSSILCNLVGIMSGLFTQYMGFADAVFSGKEYDYYNVMTDSAFMLISFMEIYTQSESCSTTLEEVRQTGVILQKANSNGIDVRLRESMEIFSLRILQRNFKIKPLGLFEVDLSLIHGVFSTVTGFLLILIQSDLSRRFLQ